MAIQFRCRHCQALMSIATRRAGSLVACPVCDEQVLVPMEDAQEAESIFKLLVPDMPLPPEERPSAVEPKPPAEAAPAGGDEATEAQQELPAEKFTLPIRASRIDDEMDLTPMVDVVFQLLIFFMVTASFAMHKTIQTPTPDADQKGATQSIQTLDDLQGAAIVVRIDGQNGITIDDEPLATGAPVADALRDKMRREQKSEIIISADAAAWHRTVVGVIDASNAVGMQKIRLASRGGAD